MFNNKNETPVISQRLVLAGSKLAELRAWQNDLKNLRRAPSALFHSQQTHLRFKSYFDFLVSHTS